MRIVGGRIVRCALAMALLAYGLLAQNATGSIQLSVKDASGAPMRASVKARNLRTGIEEAIETNDQGRIELNGLAEGRYRLDVSKPGFTTQSTVVEVKSGQPVAAAVTLAVGPQSFKVDVVDTAPLAGVERTV